MKKKLLGLFAALVLFGSILIPVHAADLYFQVPREVVNLYLNKDGTASVEYYIDFQNEAGGDLIDAVDVGVPTSNYDLSSVTADIGGKKITDISDSPYVHPGIAVGLGSSSIQSGKSGELHVYIKTVRDMFYEADTPQKKEAYTSINFEPSYFDSSYAHGITDLSVNIILPPGVQQDEPLYFTPTGWPGSADPTSGYTPEGLAFYTWRTTNANAYSEYKFGAAFPARLIPASVIQKKPLINFTINWNDVIGYGFCGCFALIFGLSIYGATVGAKKRKLAYLPPKIAVEGMGIKRGLTAVEAAILMEQPMDRILTMILFSVVKKGAATVVSKDPMTIKVTSPLPDGLQTYETDFLKAFETDDLAGSRRRGLQTMMVNLVKEVTEKMKGFSRKDTVAYYTDIMKKAWDQVEAAQTPDVKMQAFDDQMDWTMLDNDFDNRTRRTFVGGPVFIPMWWGNFDPAYHTSGPSIPTGGGNTNISIPRPNVPGADFAQSLVNGITGFSGKAVGDLTTFTSGVTNVTNPAPVSTSSSGSFHGGGGGHCACACACAGCACACAGGGR